MSGFAEACGQVAEELEADLIVGSNEAAMERVSDPLRLEEAGAVAPCAERFVGYEVAPPTVSGRTSYLRTTRFEVVSTPSLPR